MSKNVQIPRELFIQLLQYFCDDTLDDDTFAELSHTITIQLNDKLDKMVQRELFTKYKNAATPEEREVARLKYLDSVGIHKDFRTDEEISFTSP